MWLVIREEGDWYSIVEMTTDEMEARSDAMKMGNIMKTPHWVTFMNWDDAYEEKN